MKIDKTKAIIIFSMTLIFLLYNHSNTFAAPLPDPGCDPGDPTCPIDGGVGLLIAVGLGFGYQKQQKIKR